MWFSRTRAAPDVPPAVKPPERGRERATDPVMSDYEAHGFVDVITKPYKIEELSRVLHGVIHEAAEKMGDGSE